MATKSKPKAVEAGSELPGGYQPELKRTLGSFQVFAISFAFISVAVGIFGTYDDLLQTGGPVAIWLWPIVAAGQTLVALVIAQFAARIPLAGSSYQWASRLASPKIGWGFGWLSFCFLAIGVVAVDNALASKAFMPLFGIGADEGKTRLITLAVLLVQTVLVAASTRIVGGLNSGAVVVELAVVAALGIALVVVVAITGHGSVSNLTSRGMTAGDGHYFGFGGGLMLAMLVGIATLVGFDAAANLAEEAKDPYRSVPRAIVASVVVASVVGMLFLIALTVAIPNIKAASNTDSAVALITRVQLGVGVQKVVLVAIMFSFFAAGVVTMTTGARLVYAMSRDARFPGHRVMRRVNSRTQTPIPATILIFAGGVVLMECADPADHGGVGSNCGHLWRHGRPLPGGTQRARSQGGRVLPRALRAAGCDQRDGVGGRGACCAGDTSFGPRPRRDRRRLGPCGRGVLPRHAEVQP